MIKSIPTFKITIDDTPESGCKLVSLVENPAVEIKGFTFDNIKDLFQLKLSKDKQIIAGPAIIADKPIYRFDEKLGEFYVIFDAETIKAIWNKFITEEGLVGTINVDHSDTIVNAKIIDHWFIEDPENDKSKDLYGFENLTKGSVFVVSKINDEKFWNEEVKGKGKSGYSIEGFFDLESIREKFIQNKKQNEIQMTKLKFGKETLKDGTVIYVSKMEVDGSVKTVDENGDSVPLFDGEHILSDDSSIVTVDGKITEVKPKVETEMATDIVDTTVEEVEPAETDATEVMELDPTEVMAIVQPKFDEVYAMLAEIKNMIEAIPMDMTKKDVKTEMSKTEKLMFTLNSLAKK